MSLIELCWGVIFLLINQPKKHKKNMKVAYYTEEGLRALKAELDQLRDVERPRASQAIAEARDKGDLSENAEYDAAKEAQGLLELNWKS